MTMKITALASWYGSNRMLAERVGAALGPCDWVGVPFAGGMSELLHITCRTGVANDLHKHVINLAQVAAHPRLGPMLWRQLRRVAFHPTRLAAAQENCRLIEARSVVPSLTAPPVLQWAIDYFVCVWMARNGTAGTKSEFDAGLSFRWEAGGGDSVVRFRNAAAGLSDWRMVLAKWTFDCRDAFEFLDECHRQDRPGHGIYCDPPFPGPGNGYKHNCGKTDAAHRAWHTRLRDSLARFTRARIVCRYYDHPLVRELYPDGAWTWQRMEGRTQTNNKAAEVLLVNRPAGASGLFGEAG